MILVKPSHKILWISGDAKSIESAGRVCYKSEDRITNESADKFVKSIRDRGHHSVLEHSAMSVNFICDRGVTHEIVRHRLAAYSQESTRYCNYKGGVTFIIPPWLNTLPGEYKSLMGYIPSKVRTWFEHMLRSEQTYIQLLKEGWSPQQARSVLTNSLKTEIVMTANFREWRHVFTLRCSKAAHPQMRELMIPLLEECKERLSILFEDIKY